MCISVFMNETNYSLPNGRKEPLHPSKNYKRAHPHKTRHKAVTERNAPYVSRLHTYVLFPRTKYYVAISLRAIKIVVSVIEVATSRTSCAGFVRTRTHTPP